MASIRTWRMVAGALLLLVVLATAGTPAVAGEKASGHRAHYCKRVDAYRIKTCATALLPAGPLGRQLRWELAQLAGEAATLTEAEVQAHFSAEFLTVMYPPEVVVQFFHQNLAERGPFTFIGFAYPPRARQALAILQGRTGERGALPIGVTSGHPALIEYLDLAAASPTVVPKGRFSGWFDIGGRWLFLRCTGHGGPTVVFESHLTHDWVALQNQLAGFTRVCSWDHPSGPWSRSDPATGPQTARDIVADLHALLRVAGVPGPYVVAGHSNTGLFTLLYASTHPRQVAGLVLIDAVHPAYHKRQLALVKPLLPPEIWEALRLEAMAVPHRLIDPEQLDIWTSERQTRVALRRSPLRPMPLVVLTRGHPEPAPPWWPVEQTEALWLQLQRELAAMVPGSRHVITQSGHNIQDEQPELVLDAIRDVVLAVRAGDLVPH
jgi:pimeloyl-ACP methyl ester carboxylesterase